MEGGRDGGREGGREERGREGGRDAGRKGGSRYLEQLDGARAMGDPLFFLRQLTDYFPVDMLGVWYNSVKSGTQKSPGSPNK